jgi:hypothetical protein
MECSKSKINAAVIKHNLASNRNEQEMFHINVYLNGHICYTSTSPRKYTVYEIM